MALDMHMTLCSLAKFPYESGKEVVRGSYRKVEVRKSTGHAVVSA